MMRREVGLSLLLLTASATLAAPAKGQSTKADLPKTDVRLVSSVDRVVAGTPFDVAIHFKLPDGWHTYWQNSGDSGQPPRVLQWTLPEGFEAGELMFPAPKSLVSPGNIVTNILEGEPVLLVRITPPAAISADQVTLAAKLRYLICKKTCVIQYAELETTLPVAAKGGTSQPVEEKLFRRARRALPKTKSRYVSITARTEPTAIAPGAHFELIVDARIKPGFHIQSHEPLNPAFIKCELFIESRPGVFLDEPRFPPPSFRMLKIVGKVSEYAGKISMRVPAELDRDVPAGTIDMAGVFKYQACNEKGTCFPPEALAFAAKEPLRVAGDAGAPAGASRNADISPDQSDSDVATTGRKSPGTDATATPTTTPPADSAIADAPADASAGGGIERFLRGLGTPGLLLMCFIYGLVINITPCVLPLLSIKVLSFVQQAHESRARTFALGLSFGGGVIVFFVVLGLLASQGRNILQFPLAVIALNTVVTMMALSMLGVFTLQVPTSATKLEASIQKEGMFASFGKGALAPVLGFACTAPMMAGGFAWATQQSKELAIVAFLVMGAGMAFPYILLGANPDWLSFLPKPGNWMITFERLMGFLLLGLVVLLLHPLLTQLGTSGFEWTLVFLVTVGLGCWMLGKVEGTMPSPERWRYRGGAAAVIFVAGATIFGWIAPLNRAEKIMAAGNGEGLIAWRTWSPAEVEREVRAGKTVFVDFTAAYCTNCKINKAVAIDTPATAAKLDELDAIAFQADFSVYDERIAQALQKHGRPGPPLNLVYPPGRYDEPIVLDILFSQQYLLEKLEQAGPSRGASVAKVVP